MEFKVAIHDRPGSYSDRWIEYCRNHGISYITVDCHDNDIMTRLQGIGCLLWHWSHADPADQLCARQVIAAAEQAGMRVFPNTATCWHFDDKVGQKYLLEAAGVPLVDTFVFYTLKEALYWVETAEFPKVFKLRCGASAENVKLVGSRSAARSMCRKAFESGFPAAPGYFGDFRAKVRMTGGLQQFRAKLGRMPGKMMRILKKRKYIARQIGYVYFQEFLPGNTHDTRVTVIGDKAFAFQRKTRVNDFRASGSGQLVYDPEAIDVRCIAIAFETARKLQTQSLALDFINDQAGKPRIVEISYCYMSSAVYACHGYWDPGMVWHKEQLWPENEIIRNIINIAGGQPPEDLRC